MREKWAAGVLATSLILTAGGAGAADRPVANVIFDTDMGNDCDDAGALAVLHALADNGEANILACMMLKMRKNEPVVGPLAFIDAINTYYGRPDIPIGVGKKWGAYMADPKNYTSTMAGAFPNDTVNKTIDEIPHSIDLYRQILAAQPDKSVTIVALGPLLNLRYLLASEPDNYSPLSGRELVDKKVKLLSVMGGRFPEGGEFNLGNGLAGGISVAMEWPGRAVWSGYEIGGGIHTGEKLTSTPDANPVRAAYKEYGMRRQSWDQTSVLYAVRGLADYWEENQTPGYYCIVPLKVPGYPNHWETQVTRDHTYLKIREPASDVTAEIDALLAQKSATPATTTSTAVNVILDSSLQTADEAGALAMLHALSDKGEVNFLGCVYPGKSDKLLEALDAINTYRGRPELPIAKIINKDVPVPDERIAEAIQTVADTFPNDTAGKADSLPDSSVLYRKLLAAQSDKSVTIICTGWQNGLAGLLMTKADDVSPLTGRELVAQKVKLLCIAGGQYPGGSDFLYKTDQELTSAITVSAAWPTRVVYTGVEVGKLITAGAALAGTGDEKDPIKKIFAVEKNAPYGGIAMAATLYAVRGKQSFWDDTTGANTISLHTRQTQWQTSLLRKDQTYLKMKKPTAEMEQIISDLMCQPPKAK